MASTNHTQEYQLCQWVEDDPVLREDFNADNLKTEAALAAIKALMETRKPVFGSYQGTGITNSQDISLGFRPSWIFVTASTKTGGMYYNGSGLDFGMCFSGMDTDCLTITANGIRVKGSLNYLPSDTSNYGIAKSPYRYIALR